MTAAQDSGGGNAVAGRSPGRHRSSGQHTRADAEPHRHRGAAGEGPLPAKAVAPGDGVEPPPSDRARRLIRGLGIALLLLALTLRLRPDPGRLQQDPLLRRLAAQDSVPTLLRGQVLEEPRRPPAERRDPTAPVGQPGGETQGSGRGGEGPCKVLIDTGDSRSELALPSCTTLRPGWRVQASGMLQRLDRKSVV